MNRVVVAGYHGYQNAGDDATLITIINNIKKIDNKCHITVLSSNPGLTKECYGVHSINRFNPFEVVTSIFRSNALILGGGTLIQDSTSTRSLRYYILLMEIALFFKKKVMLYSNGMGPINLEKNRKIAAKVLNRVNVITLRENYASEFLKKLGVCKPKIIVTADPAFSLNTMLDEEKSEIMYSLNIPLDKKLIGISIRECEKKEKFVNQVAELCDYLIEKYDYNILFIPFQYGKDNIISEEIVTKMKNEAYVINKKCSVSEIINIMSICYINICMRLHSVIFSALSGVPVLGIVYDPKVEYYLNILEQVKIGTNKEINQKYCYESVENIVNNYDEVKKKLINKANELTNDTTKK